MLSLYAIEDYLSSIALGSSFLHAYGKYVLLGMSPSRSSASTSFSSVAPPTTRRLAGRAAVFLTDGFQHALMQPPS